MKAESFDKTFFEEVLIVPLTEFKPDINVKKFGENSGSGEIVTPSNMVTRDHFPLTAGESKVQ